MPREIVNSVDMKMVLVPFGTFWMGDRGRQTPVSIPRNFFIGACPVTQGQWADIMGSNPSWFGRSGYGADKVKGFSEADLKMFPVEQVSWDDVQEFLKRLNERENKRGFLYRLPSEAEWEYACRGGATTPQHCAFDFYFAQTTNDLSSDLANFDGSRPAGGARKGRYLERTTKVGSYPPNQLGIFDMHGNVWEWCQDLFWSGRSARAFRGGCWRYDGPSCRASYRCLNGREPGDQSEYLGFRIVAIPSDE